MSPRLKSLDEVLAKYRSIFDSLNSQSDLTCDVVTTAYLEHLLGSMLQTHFVGNGTSANLYGGPHCLDQKTDLIRETGDSQSPALSFWGSGSAQVSAANRSGATAPKRRPSLLLVYGRAIGPFTVTFPWYTSHGVSYAKLW